MGAYDATEHERRERKNNTVEMTTDETRTEYEGSLEYDSGESAEALLDQFQQIKSS